MRDWDFEVEAAELAAYPYSVRSTLIASLGREFFERYKPHWLVSEVTGLPELRFEIPPLPEFDETRPMPWAAPPYIPPVDFGMSVIIGDDEDGEVG